MLALDIFNLPASSRCLLFSAALVVTNALPFSETSYSDSYISINLAPRSATVNQVRSLVARDAPPVGVVAGSVVGAVTGISLFVAILWFYFRRNKMASAKSKSLNEGKHLDWDDKETHFRETFITVGQTERINPAYKGTGTGAESSPLNPSLADQGNRSPERPSTESNQKFELSVINYNADNEAGIDEDIEATVSYSPEESSASPTPVSGSDVLALSLSTSMAISSVYPTSQHTLAAPIKGSKRPHVATFLAHDLLPSLARSQSTSSAISPTTSIMPSPKAAYSKLLTPPDRSVMRLIRPIAQLGPLAKTQHLRRSPSIGSSIYSQESGFGRTRYANMLSGFGRPRSSSMSSSMVDSGVGLVDTYTSEATLTVKKNPLPVPRKSLPPRRLSMIMDSSAVAEATNSLTISFAAPTAPAGIEAVTEHTITEHNLRRKLSAPAINQRPAELGLGNRERERLLSLPVRIPSPLRVERKVSAPTIRSKVPILAMPMPVEEGKRIPRMYEI